MMHASVNIYIMFSVILEHINVYKIRLVCLIESSEIAAHVYFSSHNEVHDCFQNF
jgi:hypothetical protein